MVKVLAEHGVKQYKEVNVAADKQLEEAVKELSDWPTIPQLYIKGQFVGSCSAVQSLISDSDDNSDTNKLKEVLEEEGII